MFGAIEALRGYYVYLGNTFVINSGRITFSGETPSNPEIAAEASKEDRGAPYKVYFSASGTMQKPKISLSSDPSMEERDIISYLVTGKPLYEAYSQGSNGGQAGHGDTAAQNLAAGYLSQQAAMTVGRKLELDIVNLKVNPGNQADLTIGRYVTKDLFISYGQVLGQGGERRVSAEYSITRFLSLEGKNSSDGIYGTDLLFKFGIR
jgi:translocation and assembly module TamB